jgi:PAS domain S-box-containing protein
MINLFHSGLALALPVIPHMGLKITAERARRQEAELLLESVNAVSRERLALDKVLPRVAEDFQRVLLVPVGGIWLSDGVLAHAWPDTESALALEATCQQTLAENRVLVEQGLLSLPIAWRGRLLAVCVMRCGVPLRRVPLHALLEMAEELAPILDNSILYTETLRQNTLLEAILSGSPVGIVVTDEALCVLRANTALDEALGVSALDYRGKPLADLLADAGIKPEMQTRLLHRLQEGDEFQDELRLEGATFNADAAPLPRGGWVIMINDVSMLAELNRIKTQMIRIASHDLRNPLGLVLNYGELILMRPEETEISANNRRFVENMVQAGEEMLRVIDSILNVEKLPFGKNDRQ